MTTSLTYCGVIKQARFYKFTMMKSSSPYTTARRHDRHVTKKKRDNMHFIKQTKIARVSAQTKNINDAF